MAPMTVCIARRKLLGPDSLLHEGLLIIPYAMADYATTFATVPLEDVLRAMVPVTK